MSYNADTLKVQTTLEHRVCPVPFLGNVQGKADVPGPSQNFRGAACHGFHVIHETESFFHPLRVAAHVFKTKDGITMTGQVARLGEVRVPVSAASV
jgi:hypothetical protein